MLYHSSSYLQLPEEPGVYEFLDKVHKVLYVGKAKNLKHRVASYFTKSYSHGEKTQQLICQIMYIRITVVDSELESLLLEAVRIKKFNPKYNSRLTDGKAYPLIRITIKEKYPKILIARKEDDKKSLYFGPYPSTSSIRMVLKLMRRIFPYENVEKHPKKPCLYYHLGLCPCAEAFDSKNMHVAYKKTIKHIVQFLHGEKIKILKDLEKEREEWVRTENFEHAGIVQKQIDQVKMITSKFHKPFEYELNPNLREDIRALERNELLKHLRGAGIKIDTLFRIECYDISNTSGQNATASMVVLTNGEIDKSEYKRFKIKLDKGKPDDFAMIEEVLTRRLKHAQWPMPDLIIVDGGKGQISSAVKAIKQLGNVTIPIVGLAKREETIITEDFREISLSKSSPALKLVMRIRDEAHRFALRYHRLLRSRSLMNS